MRIKSVLNIGEHSQFLNVNNDEKILVLKKMQKYTKKV